MNISSTNTNSYTFGTKIVKNTTYKSLIKAWKKQFPEKSIDKALTKIKKSADNSFRIEFLSMDLIGRLHCQIKNDMKVPLKYLVECMYRDNTTLNNDLTIYSPTNIAKKITKIIKLYNKQTKKEYYDVFHNLIVATKNKTNIICGRKLL